MGLPMSKRRSLSISASWNLVSLFLEGKLVPKLFHDIVVRFRLLMDWFGVHLRGCGGSLYELMVGHRVRE